MPTLGDQIGVQGSLGALSIRIWPPCLVPTSTCDSTINMVTDPGQVRLDVIDLSKTSAASRIRYSVAEGPQKVILRYLTSHNSRLGEKFKRRGPVVESWHEVRGGTARTVPLGGSPRA